MFIFCKDSYPEKEIKAINSDDTYRISEFTQHCNCDDAQNLEIKTQYIALPDSPLLVRMVVLSQNLTIRNVNENIEVVNPLSYNESYQLENENLKIQSVLIFNIKCVKNNRNYIYSIYGGGIDSVHEFYGFLSKEGKWLYYYYGGRNGKETEFGSIKSLKKEYGKKSIESQANMIEVLPTIK